MCMKTRHVIILIIALMILFFLWKWDNVDHFDVIQQYPFLPPKYWTPLPAKKWTPWYYQENAAPFYTSVPSVVNYGTDFYRFPQTNCVNKQTAISAQGQTVQTPKQSCKQVQMHPYKSPNSCGVPVEGFDPNGPDIEEIGCGGCMRGEISPMDEMVNCVSPCSDAAWDR